MSSDLLVPGRIQHDNNVVAHWWSFEDVTGNIFTEIDPFFGTVRGGAGGTNPVIGKHYTLDNIGVMLRHLSASNPPVAITWRFNEGGADLSSFLFTPTNRFFGPNKACGSWSPCRTPAPCDSYNLHVSVAPPGIAFVSMLIHFTWKVTSDAA